MSIVIGCVGKPSAGKSSFLNAATGASAKVGNYPFTTIEPNHGVSWFIIDCPCARHGKTDVCKPVYGKCENGKRFVPVEMLDVAGLVPGASEGQGLGNQFLNDLCGADVLLHIVDVSGTTNEKGEETTGYDPINDIDWLTSEIHAWIFNNLWKKWDSTARRHNATKANVPATLLLQLSGYGCRLPDTQRVCDVCDIREPCDLAAFDADMVHRIVSAFIDIRFPTFYVLNKVDSPESDKNIARICRKYDENKIVLTSALAECLLRKMAKEQFIRYEWGSSSFTTADDEENSSLHPLDEKVRGRLDKVKDMVLFRYGSTGVQEAIQKAVTIRGLIPVFPVQSLTNFTSDDGSTFAFRQCFLVKPGTTVGEFASKLGGDAERRLQYVERLDGTRISEDDTITLENNILKYSLARAGESAAARK